MRLMMSLMIVLLTALSAHAHMVFIVPGERPGSARVLMSEDLRPDERIDLKIIRGAKLQSRSSAGQRSPLQLKPGTEALTTTFDSTSVHVLFGEANVGVMQRGDDKPHLLIYHPKTILGDAFDPAKALEDLAPVELVPVGAPGAVRLRFLVNGEPKANAEVAVVLPDHSEQRFTTDTNGETQAFSHSGRLAAWGRHWEEQSGELTGKKYEQVRRYATLVFDVPETKIATKSSSGRSRHHRGAEQKIEQATVVGKLPQATSSFGAAALGDFVYVYGGHIAPTHEYSTAAVSGQFWRAPLRDLSKWETLPAGPPMQGMNLAAHNGAIYRVGGMQPRNAPGAPEDIRSLNTVAKLDPDQGQWSELTPLPEPRSSHDQVVIDGVLYVVGGWTLRSNQSTLWPETMQTLDLGKQETQWSELPQPFQRRAIIAAVHDGKLYVLGGFDSNDRPSRRVDIFDPGSRHWTQGPGLLGPAINGFAPAACEHKGRLYVSLGDGNVYRLDEEINQWTLVATNTPRIVHRMIAAGEDILILGGASKGDNHDLIESFTPTPDGAKE